MDFNLFIKELEKELGKPLPGKSAQYKMAPPGRDLEAAGKEPKKSAVIVLLYEQNGKVKVLFMKRAVNNSIHSGQLSFPGGQKDNKDKTLQETALRELYEEVGIDDVKIIGELTPLYISVSNFSVYPFVGYLNKEPVFKINSDEVEKIVTVDLETLKDEKNRTFTKVNTKYAKNYKVPCFKLDDEILWGATAMITNELLEILKNAGIQFKLENV